MARGELDEWKTTKQGKMAAVILADQLSRNIFRKHKDAFAYDHISLEIVKSIPDEEFFQYGFQEQTFLVMPYQHSENLADQEKSI